MYPNMKKLLRILGWSLAVIAVLTTGVYAWARWVASSRYDKQWVVHEAAFPIPFPLDETERAALRE